MHSTDISQIAFKSMAIISKLRRRCNSFPSVAFRWPDFGELAVTGRPFPHIFRHRGIPLPHFSPPVDALGLRRNGSPSEITNQAQDFLEQFPRHGSLG